MQTLLAKPLWAATSELYTQNRDQHLALCKIYPGISKIFQGYTDCHNLVGRILSTMDLSTMD